MDRRAFVSSLLAAPVALASVPASAIGDAQTMKWYLLAVRHNTTPKLFGIGPLLPFEQGGHMPILAWVPEEAVEPLITAHNAGINP